jgi:hypothetical protein
VRRLLLALVFLFSCHLPGAHNPHPRAAAASVPGRAPTAAEREALEALLAPLAIGRKVQARLPQVRFVETGEHRALLRRAALRERRPAEEQALKLIGLVPMEAGLPGARVAADPPASWWAGRDILLVREGALESDELRFALAQSLSGECAPAADDRDARMAARALSDGMATVALLAARAEEAGSDLIQVAPDVSHVREVVTGRNQLPGLPPAVQDELAWSRGEGAALALRLYRSGAWQTLDRACEAPPPATAAVMYPRRWERGLRGLAVGAPRVREWEALGFESVGEERLGQRTLATWLESVLGEEPELSGAWRGDAVRVYERGGEHLAAWTIALGGGEQRAKLLLALGEAERVFSDLSLAWGPGDAITLMFGATGVPAPTISAPIADAPWPARIHDDPDPDVSVIGRRYASQTLTWNGEVVTLGEDAVVLRRGWQRLPGGVAGHVLTLTSARTGVRVELNRTPRVLTGALEEAAVERADLMRKQVGILEEVMPIRREGFPAARVEGVASSLRHQVVEVVAVPVGDDVIEIVGSWHGARAAPKAWLEVLEAVTAISR